jgi:hypothetical protein
MMTEEQIIARLEAVRLDRPRQPAPPKPAAVKAKERFAEANQPTEAVIDAATAGNAALARRIEAERVNAENVRIRYQRELDRWWQAKLDAEAALNYDYSRSFHRGPGDPDWGL